ncbi:rhamnulokinase [Plantibacter flavus]|uniref:rhamnulokinase n=1 Tax=Plantibacter flavus TaxID=150123 RepID=UPI003F1553D6
MTHPVPDRFHAAVDLGASSGRVMLGRLGADGLELREVRRFANAPVEIAGELHWDVERLFTETLRGLAEAVRQAAAAGRTLDGIGVDSWGVDGALVRDAGQDAGMRNPPPVRHHRGADPAEPARAALLVPTPEAYAVSGVLEQAINTSSQLRSRLRTSTSDELPGTLQLVPDLWVHLLTGAIGAERTIASTTQLFDQRTGTWADELIERWGLDAVTFPPVSDPGTLAGMTTAAVTSALGASDPIPVYRVAEHDTASALAFAAPDGAELLVSSGSWSLAGVCLGAPVLTEEARLAEFTNEAGASGTTLLLRNLSGMWLLTECARSWSIADAAPLDPVDLVIAARDHARSEPGDASAPPVFDVGDARLLAPGDMPSRIAALCVERCGVAPEGRLGTVRSIVESLAAAYADTVAACEALTGTTVRTVRIVGGGSRNALLAERTAARTGLPVTTGPAEASSLGNLAVQLVAAGAVGTIQEAYAAFDRREASSASGATVAADDPREAKEPA